MKKLFASLVGTLAIFAFVSIVKAAGFDEFGYNPTARNFVGTGSSWCQGKLDLDKIGCDAYMYPYQNDHLVMKWNNAWDECNEAGNNDASVCLGAWTSNEWNGKVLGGSGEVWHYKIIWVGSAGEESPYWRSGGYTIWGSYEVIMDQGTADGVHSFPALGKPAGYGTYFSH